MALKPYTTFGKHAPTRALARQRRRGVLCCCRIYSSSDPLPQSLHRSDSPWETGSPHRVWRGGGRRRTTPLEHHAPPGRIGRLQPRPLWRSHLLATARHRPPSEPATSPCICPHLGFVSAGCARTNLWLRAHVSAYARAAPANYRHSVVTPAPAPNPAHCVGRGLGVPTAVAHQHRWHRSPPCSPAAMPARRQTSSLPLRHPPASQLSIKFLQVNGTIWRLEEAGRQDTRVLRLRARQRRAFARADNVVFRPASWPSLRASGAPRPPGDGVHTNKY